MHGPDGEAISRADRKLLEPPATVAAQGNDAGGKASTDDYFSLYRAVGREKGGGVDDIRGASHAS